MTEMGVMKEVPNTEERSRTMGRVSITPFTSTMTGVTAPRVGLFQLFRRAPVLGPSMIRTYILLQRGRVAVIFLLWMAGMRIKDFIQAQGCFSCIPVREFRGTPWGYDALRSLNHSLGRRNYKLEKCRSFDYGEMTL